MDEKPEILTPVEARQGFLGRPVLLVLIVSMILACGSIVLALVWDKLKLF